jgi:glycerol-3-phosphate dehydrogenase
MTRNFSQLSHKVYDVAVIGGGVYGISVARDAAFRGLTVAVVERGDFGNATSSNHHRIIHGGLRYLQHVDLKRMRESIRERNILLRIAPHLVHPLPFLIPTYQYLTQGRLLLSLALKMNDLISLDRNRNLEPHKKIPRGRLISKSECLQLCPNINQRDLTGGAFFFWCAGFSR